MRGVRSALGEECIRTQKTQIVAGEKKVQRVRGKCRGQRKQTRHMANKMISDAEVACRTGIRLRTAARHCGFREECCGVAAWNSNFKFPEFCFWRETRNSGDAVQPEPNMQHHLSTTSSLSFPLNLSLVIMATYP